MTNMTNTEYAQPQARSFTEHLVFVALLLPTFVVLAAAFVSLAQPDPAVEIQQPMLTAVACPCTGQEGVEGP
ncbi:MAG TPA: hypothetical protein VM183_05915 [Burkholderiales bacterium]|nr:hypothetical protein [Burkholderiales bacterium]